MNRTFRPGFSLVDVAATVGVAGVLGVMARHL